MEALILGLQLKNSYDIVILWQQQYAVLFSLLIFLSFQALEASKKEHSLTLKIVKEKIISTE